jgi:Putative transposase/Transposase zinc-binding domain
MVPAGEMPAAAAANRPHWEVADVFRSFGEDYRRAHPLPWLHRQVMHDIEVCRTAVLGGHLQQCDSCNFQRPCYNSCRNRHCPKCGSLEKARWLDQRQAEMLPVGYFHLVFTLPHELNSLILANKKALLHLLFQAVSQTLLDFGRTHLGGQLGFLAVLHTWDQTLGPHFHLHCLIPGGALSFDHSHWIAARDNFLFPVQALSRVFRGKFLAGLQQLFADDLLQFPGQTAVLATSERLAALIRSLRTKDWNVYAKKPFASPEKVLDYLGRYTHRVAISNHRLRSVENGQVSFAYRDRREGNTLKSIRLNAHEFIRRFLLHVLPSGFMRIRHFGFLANRSKKHALSHCRQLLGVSAPAANLAPKSALELMRELTGVDLSRCPYCHRGTLIVIQPLPAAASTPLPPRMDSS